MAMRQTQYRTATCTPTGPTEPAPVREASQPPDDGAVIGVEDSSAAVDGWLTLEGEE